MPPLRRHLPSLNALATFEAAARLGGFTLAAAELGVTQAAVSRQIRALEQDLGTALFHRRHRRVEPTRAGQVLAAALSSSLEQMADAVAAVRAVAAEPVVTLGTTLAFAHFWLLPRLPAFRKAHPDIRLRLVSQDEAADLRHGGIDILIRYGTPPFADGKSVASLHDEVFPVANPAVAAGGASVHDLPLISTEWVEPSWMTWADWARAAGQARLPGESALRFNHYTDGVLAALAGEGAILGWRRLIAPLLADGRLVRIGQDAVHPPAAYHVLIAPGASPAGAGQRVVDWLAAAFADPDMT